MIRTLHRLHAAWVRLPIIVLLLTVTSFVWGQDPSFSQFYANRIYLNPAFTGIEGGISVSGAARAQWIAVDKGFRTYAATAETQLPFVGMGVGLHLLHNQEGIGSFTTNQAGMTLSYTIPGEKHNVHFGFEGRFVQKSIDWEKLVFSEQLDPIYGVVYPGSITPVTEQVMYGDLDFGAIWRHEGDFRLGRKGLRKIRSHLGVSFHHLPYLVSASSEGNDSFFNSNSRVAPRTTIHGGMIIPIKFYQGSGHEISISPNFKLDMQGYKFLDASENITVGTVGMYGMMSNFYLGLFYQNKYYAPSAIHTDALIVTAGGYANAGSKGPRFFFGLSADFNITGVGPAAGSVFEATFRYTFDQNIGFEDRKRGGNRRGKKVLDCKSFF